MIHEKTLIIRGSLNCASICGSFAFDSFTRIPPVAAAGYCSTVWGNTRIQWMAFEVERAAVDGSEMTKEAVLDAIDEISKTALNPHE